MSSTSNDADYWIEKLQLSRHPEGGYFREVYRSAETISSKSLPTRYVGSRVFSTSIYFLLKGNEISHLHRLKSDELWHFYSGSSLTLHVIDGAGKYFTANLGQDLQKGQIFQAAIRAGCWFGATVEDQGSYSLIGCTVAPGFDFDDFELGERKSLLALFPQHQAIIERLTI